MVEASEFRGKMKRKGFGVAKRRRLIRMALFLLSVVFLGSLYLHSLSESGSPVAEAENEAQVKNKIAFLFIARNRLPLDMIWHAFFQEEKERRFSILVHSRPGFVLNKVTTRSPFFFNRQINNSVQVDWGEASMLKAERILLRTALLDPDNNRFVFLSDSCIPLYNFNYTYDYIMSSTRSFVDSFADTKEGRYNPKMNPVIPIQDWRKGSQCLISALLSIYIKCNSASLLFTSIQLFYLVKHLQLNGYARLPWWAPDILLFLYYETEHRREWCTSKGRPAPCFLFSRKFTRSAALKLLNMV